MAFNIPTTKETFDSLLANIESRINQASPLLARAFNRTIAASLSLVITGLYKFAANRAKQSLALTASGDDLHNIGLDRSVIFRGPVAAVVTADILGTDGTVISSTISFTADANGLRYFPSSSQVISGGTAALTLTCETVGAEGGLINGSVLTIGAQVSGAATVATVTGTTVIGADEEAQETYRGRVLTAQRVTPGGGNYSDYRIWAEEATGVRRAYPYAGRPITDPIASVPPERTVYVEAQESIDADGIAPQVLLDAVLAMIIADPSTGFERQPLGLTNDTLYIESIVRLPVFVEVQGLLVDPAKDAQARADIETALDVYFKRMTMFVVGLDFDGDRNDTLSIASIGGVVDDALRATSGSISSVRFGFDAFLSETRYQLRPGELVKNGTISYA